MSWKKCALTKHFRSFIGVYWCGHLHWHTVLWPGFEASCWQAKLIYVHITLTNAIEGRNGKKHCTTVDGKDRKEMRAEVRHWQRNPLKNCPISHIHSTKRGPEPEGIKGALGGMAVGFT